MKITLQQLSFPLLATHSKLILEKLAKELLEENRKKYEKQGIKSFLNAFQKKHPDLFKEINNEKKNA